MSLPSMLLPSMVLILLFVVLVVLIPSLRLYRFAASYSPLAVRVQLYQVLLSKNSALLEAAEYQDGGKARIITTRGVVRGSVTWLVMAAFAVYALVSVVEEELAFQFGAARVTLVITQVCR